MEDKTYKPAPITEDRVKQIIQDYLRTQTFNQFKVTDTPRDGLQVTPMKYVNMFGSVVGVASSILGAPSGSVIGQQYFATDLGYPIFKNQNSRWVSATGSLVA